MLALKIQTAYDTVMMNLTNENMDIGKYLQFLDDEGWWELIDERWKNEVKSQGGGRFFRYGATRLRGEWKRKHRGAV